MKPLNLETGHPTRPDTVALWAAAALASVVLNAALFTLLPGLVDRDPVRPERMRVAHAVHVIRVKKPDSPLRKKVFSPPAPPSRQEEAYTSPSLDPVVPVAEPDRPVLEFEIHPKLPPQSLALPSPKIRTVPIGAPRLKAAYGVGEIDRSLTPLAKPPPAYPMRARRRGVEGWVTVRFLVNERGEVSQVEIIDADPQGVFDQAVLRSVGGWRFEPGTVDGIPVKTRVETTVRFELQ